MVSLRPGDRISVRLKSGTIVSPQEAYDESRVFEVVSNDNYGFYLFIPHYIHITGTTTADAARCRRLNINSRFLNEKIVYIMESMVCGIVSEADGAVCSQCGEFSDYASANQEDDTFVCWSCRMYPFFG